MSVRRLNALAGNVENFASELKELVELRARIGRLSVKRPMIAALKRIRSPVKSRLGRSRV
jgi:hypothetical protein